MSAPGRTREQERGHRHSFLGLCDWSANAQVLMPLRCGSVLGPPLVHREDSVIFELHR